ncbi:MAG: nucleotidyltransferase domain-containing protein [Nanoarchaeota archaeon]
MFKELNILKPFFENPTKQFNVREIVGILKISPTTASKNLKYFNTNKILKYQKDKIYDFYQADIDSIKYRDLKIYYSILKIRESGLVNEINKFYIKPTIILFGSVASEYDIENSDLDIVIISEKTKEFPKKKEFENKIGKELQMFIVKDLKNLKNSYLINNVLSGIVLQGEIKWI